MFDAILFDLDGTLIDTESLSVSSGMVAFSDCGYPVSEAFMHDLIGKDRGATWKIITDAMPALDQNILRPAWQKGFMAAVDKGLTLKAGAKDLLATRRLPMAIVTSSHRNDAHHKLAVAGIADAFTFVISVDDVAAPKPAPEPYLMAAERMGVSPERCLVFEDSETGAEAAFRAGCHVVQIPDILPSKGRWSHHLAPDLLSGARLVGLMG